MALHVYELTALTLKVAQEPEEDAKKLIEEYINYWLRNCLWMVRNNLSPNYREILDRIVAELGEPEHPSFRTWTSEAHWINQVAPLNDQELAEISPLELVQFLEIGYLILIKDLGQLKSRMKDWQARWENLLPIP